MKTKVMQIRLTEDELDGFRKHAEERGMSVSEYVITLDKESDHGFDNVDNRGSWVVRCLNKIRRI